MSEKEKRTYYKFKNHKLFLNEIKKYKNLSTFSLACDIHMTLITRYVTGNQAIIKDNAIAIAQTLRIPFDELFELTNVKKKDQTKKKVKEQEKSNFEISEEIICGLKKKIEDRLLITHSKSYVNEIISVIDELVIEASYLGVNCREDNTHAFIVNAITKRRVK